MEGLNAAVLNKEVTVDQMDYSYIEKCSNEKELVRILRALRSGREGFYPDLIEFCEKKLHSMNPNHRALRKQQPVLKAWDLDQNELQDLDKDMQHWASQMKTVDEEASEKKIFESRLHGSSRINGFEDRGDIPPVRGSGVLKGNKREAVNDASKCANPNRIKSYDYKAWDKFDVDKECEKVDHRASAPASEPKPVNIPCNIDVKNISEEEKMMKAVREKDKGNEAFKSGDFEEALSYYCRSICLHPIAASYNNRALVYLRLQKWKEALNDCNTVLQYEGEGHNLKAMLRRATAYKSLKCYSEATSDIQFVLDKEPNNTRAKSILNDIKKLEEAVESNPPDAERNNTSTYEPTAKKGKKMAITEVDGDSSDESENDNAKDNTMQSNDLAEKALNVKSLPELTKGQETTDCLGSSHSKEVTNSTAEAPESKNTSTDVSIMAETMSAPSFAHVNPVFPTKVAGYKTEAANLFKSGRYGEACKYYTKGIDSLSTLLETNNADSSYKVASAVLYNNRAACWLKQGNDRACIDDCNKVLDIKTWDAKAFLRRASAYENIEKWTLAWADYQSAYNMDRQNTFAQNGANRVAKHLKDIHGNKWRENVPKVQTYPYQGSVSQQFHVQTPLSTNVSTQDATVSETKESKVTQSMQGHDASDSKVTSGKPWKKASPPKETKKKQRNKRNKSKSKSPPRIQVPPTPPVDPEVESKRKKIRQDCFQKLKSEGNESVKSGKYQEAIDSYTRCIALCPKEPAVYTNRALCFLRLKKHISAVNDCTEAIELDRCNVKAYYRRALARKAENHHKDALRDIKKLLEIDPGNKAGQTELVSLKKLMEGDMKKPQPVRRKQMVIEEVDSSESSDEAEFVLPKEENFQFTEAGVSTTVKQEPKIIIIDNKKEVTEEAGRPNTVKQEAKINIDSKDEVTAGHPTTLKQQPKIKTVDDKKEINEAKLSSSLPEPEQAGKNLQLSSGNDPKAQDQARASPNIADGSIKTRSYDNKPLTPYEFGNLWSAIANKNNYGEYKALLQRVKPAELPSLLSNKIDDHVIQVVAKLALEHVNQENEYQYAYDMLRYLTKAQRFGMATMFLCDSDKKSLAAIFNAIREHAPDIVTSNEIKALEEMYL